MLNFLILYSHVVIYLQTSQASILLPNYIYLRYFCKGWSMTLILPIQLPSNRISVWSSLRWMRANPSWLKGMIDYLDTFGLRQVILRPVKVEETFNKRVLTLFRAQDLNYCADYQSWVALGPPNIKIMNRHKLTNG